jgi:hypothetical protein
VPTRKLERACKSTRFWSRDESSRDSYTLIDYEYTVNPTLTATTTHFASTATVTETFTVCFDGKREGCFSNFQKPEFFQRTGVLDVDRLAGSRPWSGDGLTSSSMHLLIVLCCRLPTATRLPTVEYDSIMIMVEAVLTAVNTFTPTLTASC